MLPILRIISVGGVLIAILLLVLARNSPNATATRLPAAMTFARGPLIAGADHPEWRDFLMQAAVQRAAEVKRLRELPDTPVRSNKVKAATTFIGFPLDRDDADPDDTTGAVPPPAGSTLPVEIGEPSSMELPVAKREETPPAITPALLKERHESRARHRKSHAAKKPKPESEKSLARDDDYMARADMHNSQ
jgi:hypothetical protein